MTHASPTSSSTTSAASCAVPIAAARDRQQSAWPMRLLAAAFLALGFMLLAADFAEAKRFGGGRSFGSKRSYSNNYSKPVSPDKNTGDQRQAAPGQQSGMSRFGGMGGMLGGLLMGGFLGSMLFGGGFGGGIGLLEIMLVGFLGFMLFKALRARRAAAEASASGGYAHAGGQYASPGGGSGWDALRSAPAGPAAGTSAATPAMPAGVDEAEFIEGAKALYARLQDSWDKRDLDDIRSFTTPEVFAEVARQIEDDRTPSTTDILMIEGRVLESRSAGGESVITVLFDALLREESHADRPVQVREVWHFHRDETAPHPEWKLEGIQQLDV